jgi:hypothetical protein
MVVDMLTKARGQDKRAMGDLIPSRSFGDFKTKRRCIGAVTATPDISTYTMHEDDRLVPALSAP